MILRFLSRTRATFGIALVATAMLLAACGGSDASTTPTATGGGTSPELAAPAASETTTPVPADTTVTAAASPHGEALFDTNGFALYGFTQDVDGVPTCSGGCAEAWPAAVVDGSTLPTDLDAEVFSLVDRGDGTFQLKAGDWPLYRFANDAAPGETNGHTVGDVWFLVHPDGSLIDASAMAMEDDAMEDDAMSDDAMEDDAMSDDAMEDDAMFDDAMSDDAMEDDAMSDDAMSDDAMEDDEPADSGGSYDY